MCLDVMQSTGTEESSLHGVWVAIHARCVTVGVWFGFYALPFI